MVNMHFFPKTYRENLPWVAWWRDGPNFWRKRPPLSRNCHKRPHVKKFVKKDPLSVAASLANWHVAHAAIGKAGMYLPPLLEPARCLNLTRDTCTPCLSTCHLSMPDLTQAAWPILDNMPALSQAVSTCRLWQWRHVPRVSWLDMSPPRGGLFWQFFYMWSFLTIRWWRWSFSSKIPTAHPPSDLEHQRWCQTKKKIKTWKLPRSTWKFPQVATLKIHPATSIKSSHSPHYEGSFFF
jgi:hypothetical protein